MPGKVELVIRNYAPGWFVVSMGTGGLSIVLHQLPYHFNGLGDISIVFFVLNLVIFVSAFIFYGARWMIAPRATAAKVIHDHSEAPYLSAAIIAFMTLVTMVALVCAESWGHGWGVFAYVLWWIGAFLSTISTVVLPFTIVRYHKESTEGLGLINSLSPIILLIPIAPLTTATAGGIICSYAGLSARLQVPVILYSWWLLGIGIFLAFMLYVLYLVRMMARSVVPPAQAPTTVIVIGPLGQAATALLILGTVVSKGTFAQYSRGTFLTASTQESIFATSVLLAALLQGFSLFWGLFTIIEFVETLYHHKRNTGSWVDQYTLTWWSLVFPIAVNTTALIQLSVVMNSPTFRTLSTIVMFIILILWFGNAVMTLKGIFTGRIFGLTGGWKQSNQPLLPEKRPQGEGSRGDDHHMQNPEVHESTLR